MQRFAYGYRSSHQATALGPFAWDFKRRIFWLSWNDRRNPGEQAQLVLFGKSRMNSR